MHILNKLPYILLLLFIASVFPVISHSKADALSCLPPDQSPLEFMQQSDAVFIGNILDTIQTEQQSTANQPSSLRWPAASYYNVVVTDSVKGPATNEQVKVFVDTTWGSTDLEQNQDYLMILNQSDDGYEEGLCEPIGITALGSPTASEYVDQFENVIHDGDAGEPLGSQDRLFQAGAMLAATGLVGALLYFTRKRKNLHKKIR